MRKTKVIATIGPSSASPEMLDALVNAGADVLDGGGGFDYVSFADATSGVTAALNPALIANAGEAVGDTYTSIEGFIEIGRAHV